MVWKREGGRRKVHGVVRWWDGGPLVGSWGGRDGCKADGDLVG